MKQEYQQVKFESHYNPGIDIKITKTRHEFSIMLSNTSTGLGLMFAVLNRLWINPRAPYYMIKSGKDFELTISESEALRLVNEFRLEVRDSDGRPYRSSEEGYPCVGQEV